MRGGDRGGGARHGGGEGGEERREMAGIFHRVLNMFSSIFYHFLLFFTSQIFLGHAWYEGNKLGVIAVIIGDE